MARGAVAATTGDEGQRVRIEGPKARVRPQTAVALSLALHELCTNALKHGALSNARGGVDLTWTLSDSAPRMLRLVWQEHGGPEVGLPPGKGFGRRLLEQALARELGGVVTLAFETPGVSCVIEAPLPDAAG